MERGIYIRQYYVPGTELYTPYSRYHLSFKPDISTQSTTSVKILDIFHIVKSYKSILILQFIWLDSGAYNTVFVFLWLDLLLLFKHLLRIFLISLISTYLLPRIQSWKLFLFQNTLVPLIITSISHMALNTICLHWRLSNFITEFRLVLEPQTHSANCLFNISLQIANKHIWNQSPDLSSPTCSFQSLSHLINSNFILTYVQIKILKSSSTLLILSHPKANLWANLLVIVENIPRIWLCSSYLLLVPQSKP